MNFDFNGFSQISEPSSVNYLKPWTITEKVSFKEVSEPITGKTKDGGEWKAWDFVFESPEGIYSERIFEPTTTERGQYNGKELPTDFERSQQFVVQVLAAYNPKGLDKLRTLTATGKIKSFEQFIAAVKKLLENTTATVKLKLQGRKTTSADGTSRWYAKLPNASIGQDGKVFMSKFIGETVPDFNSWELSQKKQYDEGAPSNPEITAPIKANDIDTSSDDDIDFSDL